MKFSLSEIMSAAGWSAFGGKKYLSIFKIGWQRELTYRFNFFLGRIRSIIVLILLYYFWHALSRGSGFFAGYSSVELFTYVFGASILKSIIFGAQSRQTAVEINDGSFSRYLIQPVNHFWFIFWREFAERSIYFLSACLEVVIFILVVKAKIIWQLNIKLILAFFVSLVLAVFLYFILSYLVSIMAFWSREAMGPRFLFEWILEFASGAYFPLNILPKIFFVLLSFAPFIYLIYFPMSIYLGKYDFWQIITGISMQIIWIITFGLLTLAAWKRGLKKYSGEGI